MPGRCCGATQRDFTPGISGPTPAERVQQADAACGPAKRQEAYAAAADRHAGEVARANAALAADLAEARRALAAERARAQQHLDACTQGATVPSPASEQHTVARARWSWSARERAAAPRRLRAACDRPRARRCIGTVVLCSCNSPVCGHVDCSATSATPATYKCVFAKKT